MSRRHITNTSHETPNSLRTSLVFGKRTNTPSATVLMRWWMAGMHMPMWRLDMEFRSCREDVPWLTRMPSEYIKEFVRFTTQPLEVPQDPQDLVKLLSLIGAQDILMFSSDYPHWDFDSPDFALKGFPDDWRPRIRFENARECFHLDRLLTQTSAAAA